MNRSTSFRRRRGQRCVQRGTKLLVRGHDFVICGYLMLLVDLLLIFGDVFRKWLRTHHAEWTMFPDDLLNPFLVRLILTLVPLVHLSSQRWKGVDVLGAIDSDEARLALALSSGRIADAVRRTAHRLVRVHRALHVAAAATAIAAFGVDEAVHRHVRTQHCEWSLHSAEWLG